MSKLKVEQIESLGTVKNKESKKNGKTKNKKSKNKSEKSRKSKPRIGGRLIKGLQKVVKTYKEHQLIGDDTITLRDGIDVINHQIKVLEDSFTNVSIGKIEDEDVLWEIKVLNDVISTLEEVRKFGEGLEKIKRNAMEELEKS